MLASFGGEEEGMWEDEHDEDEDEDDEDEDESDEEDDDDDEDDEEESEEESEEDSEGSEEESEEEEEIQNPQRRATPYSSGPVQITEAPYILPEISEAALANAQTRMNEDID